MAARDKNLRSKVEQVTGKLPSNIHVDHVKPLAKGGSNALNNLQLIPEKVHQLKTAAENAAAPRSGRRGRKGKTH
jgi:5-methylcytosine-specific restriction endonuclease McrA